MPLRTQTWWPMFKSNHSVNLDDHEYILDACALGLRIHDLRANLSQSRAQAEQLLDALNVLHESLEDLEDAYYSENPYAKE